MTTTLGTSRTTGISYPWPAPPAMGQVVPVAPGIKWLRMPLPFRLDHINLYLLEDSGGWTVVDAGIGLPRTRELWQAVFAAELDGRPVQRVLVTHFHPDHMGNAHWLTDQWNVDVWCTQGEWLMAQLAWRAGGDLTRRVAYYQHNGVGEREIEIIRARGHHYVKVVPSVAPQFHGVRDGERLTIGDREWEVLTVFGHSPEQAILHSAESSILISGDQILPSISTNVSVWQDQPLGNPLRLYLESFERFRAMASGTLVLPSHGLPFHGLPERIEALRHHHAERLALTLEATAEPRSAAEVLPVLFTRDLDPQQFGFAFGETLAHLHYLEWQGRVKRIVAPDATIRFART